MHCVMPPKMFASVRLKFAKIILKYCIASRASIKTWDIEHGTFWFICWKAEILGADIFQCPGQWWYRWLLWYCSSYDIDHSYAIVISIVVHMTSTRWSTVGKQQGRVNLQKKKRRELRKKSGRWKVPLKTSPKWCKRNTWIREQLTLEAYALCIAKGVFAFRCHIRYCKFYVSSCAKLKLESKCDLLRCCCCLRRRWEWKVEIFCL